MIEMAEDLKRDHLQLRAPREATREEIALCHRPAYIDVVERTSQLDRFDFDPDTHTSRDSYQTALLAAGGVLTAVEIVLDGAAETRSRSCALRGTMRCPLARWDFASSTMLRSRLNG